MKVMTVLRADETHASAIKKSLPEKRCVTDKYGFAVLIFILTLCFGLATLFAVLLRIPVSKIINLKIEAAVNESSTNCMALSSPLEVIYDTLSSTFKTLTNEKSLTISFTSKAVIGLLCLTPVGIFSFFMKCSAIRLTKLSTSSVPDYSCHFTIVCAGKMISTWIFLAVMYFYWTDVSQVQYITYIACLEQFELLKSNIFCHIKPIIKFKDKMKTLKNTLRYYLHHRYLILFQFLNYLTMLFLIAYVVNSVHDFFSILDAFPKMGMLFIIYFMHDYGKMVIILSRASHNWNCEHETISLKTVLSSMITISRYHCGTIVMNVPAMRLLFLIDNYDLRIDHNSGNRSLKSTNDTYKRKNLMMFTAVHGQDYSKAVKSIRYFERKNQLVTNFEDKIYSVWTDLLTIAPISLLYVVIFLPFLCTAKDLFAGIPILTLYFALSGSYLYVFINTMNTVENTIEFCNTIKSEDIKAMNEEELCQRIKNSGKSIVTSGADEDNEKRNNEIAENEEKLELPKDNIIV